MLTLILCITSYKFNKTNNEDFAYACLLFVMLSLIIDGVLLIALISKI